MKFPDDFPAQAQAEVIGEKVRASQAFNQSRQSGLPPPGFTREDQTSALAREFVLRVFYAFAHQACELGRTNVWTATRIDYESRKILRVLASEVAVEFGRLGIRHMLSEAGNILQDVLQAFISSHQWVKYQQELLEVAELQSQPRPTALSLVPTIEESAAVNYSPTQALSPEGEISRREKLLFEYKEATGRPSNRRIYTAKNSGIHKPEFYDWINGKLATTSQTCVNFERFLGEKKQPVPRNPER